jgi:autotransporter-associated beta strand protein
MKTTDQILKRGRAKTGSTRAVTPRISALGIAMWVLGSGLPVGAPAATLTLQHGVTPRSAGGTYAGTSDAWLNEGSRTENYGASYELRVKCDINDQGFAEDHPLIKFDLPALRFSSLRAATLEVFYFEAESFLENNALGIKPWRIDPAKPWFENNGGPSGKSGEGVNFRYRDQAQTQEWTGQYGGWYDKIDDGNGTNLIKRTGGTVPGAIEPGNWVRFDVRPSVSQWYGGATNNGLFLFSSAFIGSGSVCWGKFASRDTNNPALRPKLTLSYENAAIRWTAATNGNWDTNTGNWDVGGFVGRFDHGDDVTFADGASNPNITVSAAGVSPASVTISNIALSYSFTGGSIGGSGGLTKQGSGNATLAAANTYAGPTLIQAGRLIVSANNALGATAAGTVVSNCAALGLQNVNYAAAEPLSLVGTGVGGSGALYAVSGNSTFGGPVTLAGDTWIGVSSGLGLTLGQSIGGGFALTKIGAGTLTLAGSVPNTYGGATYVNQGTLALTKSTGPAVPGALFIGEGGVPATVRLDNHDQIAPTSDVTVRAGSQLNLNNYNCSVRNLALSNATVATGTGLLTLNGNVASAGDQTSQISGKLDLGGTTRAFAVADGAATDDLLISASLANGGLIKSGAGRLVLSGNSSYGGGTVVAEGVLSAASSGALGAPAGITVVSNNARLELRGDAAMGARPLHLYGHGGGPGALCSTAGTNSWSGSIRLGMTATLGAEPGAVLILNGPVDAESHALYFNATGDIALNHAINGKPGSTVIKVGPGTLTFGGSQPNTYAGSTLVWQGQLLLANDAGSAIPGDLVVGDSLIGAVASVVCAAPNQFSSQCRATVNRNATLDLNNNDAALGELTLNGGTVQTGTGTLFLGGPLNCIGDLDGWVFGNLTFFDAQDISVRDRGDLHLAANTKGGGFTKTGNGRLILANANRFNGPCTIAEGVVWVNNDPANGFGLGPAEVTVETGAWLAGTGSINGPITVTAGGILSPGNSVGTLVATNIISLGSDSILRLDVNGPTIDTLDLRHTGELGIQPNARLQLVGAFSGTGPYLCVRAASSISGTFQDLPDGAEVPGQPGWFIHYGEHRIYFSRAPQPIAYFRALSTNGVALVLWRTAEEVEITSFDLLQWVLDTGWVKVNPDPIPARNPAGAVYALVNPYAETNQTCQFRLVANTTDGEETWEFERTITEFAFSDRPRPAAEGVELRWFSRQDETYDLLGTPDLNQPLSVIVEGVPATPPENVLVLPTNAPMHFFRLRLAD